MLDPFEPALILPEAKDPKNWLGGRLAFVDKDQTGFLSISYSNPGLMINTTMVKPEEITSFRDLLDPKWKGKIVSTDPRVSGPGRSAYGLLYATKELGPDVIRQLGKQNITLFRDYIQGPEAVAQGKAAMCLGCDPAEVKKYKDQGLPLRLVDPKQIREGGAFLSGGIGVIALLNKAPHPNAAKVYLNWLLSKEGQTELGRSQSYSSRRLDVPNKDWTPAEMLPDDKFWNSYTEEGARVAEEMQPVLREVFGS